MLRVREPSFFFQKTTHNPITVSCRTTRRNIFHRETCTQIRRRDLFTVRIRSVGLTCDTLARRVFTRKMCLNENKWAKHTHTRVHTAHIHAAEGRRAVKIIYRTYAWAPFIHCFQEQCSAILQSVAQRMRIYLNYDVFISKRPGRQQIVPSRVESRQSCVHHHRIWPQRCVHVDEHRTDQDDTDIFMDKS